MSEIYPLIYPIDEAPFDLDTLVKYIKIHYSIENWEEVISLADQLQNQADEIHNELLVKKSTSQIFDKHIIYYFGYSYLMSGLSHQKLDDYRRARECISLYSSNLDKYNDSSETANLIIQDFKFFAEANTLQIDILEGKQERIPEYVEFLDKNPPEVLPGLTNIIRCANKYSLEVDEEIDQLTKHINNYSHYKGKVKAAYYLSCFYQLALYRHNREQHELAINITLHLLYTADKLGNDKYFKKAISLFEVLRKFGTISQLKSCYDILNDIIMRGDLSNEKDHNFTYSHAGFVNWNNIS